jgi:hypothetical protein
MVSASFAAQADDSGATCRGSDRTGVRSCPLVATGIAAGLRDEGLTSRVVTVARIALSCGPHRGCAIPARGSPDTRRDQARRR